MYSALKTYVILFGGVLALSTSAIFVKTAAAPPVVTAFYRLGMAALLLAPFFACSRSARQEAAALTQRQWLQILAAGCFLALHYLMWFASLDYTSVASSIVLVSLQPLFSLVLDRFAFGRRIKTTALAGCFIALAGCAVIGAGDFELSGAALWGDILAFTSAGVIALYFFVGENVRQKVSAITYSTVGYFFSALVLLAYALFSGDTLSGYPCQTWLSFGGLALVSTIGGQFVFNLLLKQIPASAVTMSILGEPVGTIILAWLLLGETVSGQQLLGIAAIMLGMGVFFITPPYKK